MLVTGTTVRVTTEPEPAPRGLAVKETLLTKVFARTLSSISLRSSIASVTFVVVVHPVYAPMSVKLPSVGVPKLIVLATTVPPALLAARKAAFAWLRAKVSAPPEALFAARKAAFA